MSHVKDRRAYNRGWVAVITKPGGGEDHSRSFATQKEAEGYRTEQDATKLCEQFVSPHAGAITLTDWWEERRALVVKLNALRPSTLARNDSYLKNHVKPKIGHHRLRDLT